MDNDSHIEDAFRSMLAQMYRIVSEYHGEDHPKVRALAMAAAAGQVARIVAKDMAKPKSMESELAILAMDQTRLN